MINIGMQNTIAITIIGMATAAIVGGAIGLSAPLMVPAIALGAVFPILTH